MPDSKYDVVIIGAGNAHFVQPMPLLSKDRKF